jgi:hypothetical protein
MGINFRTHEISRDARKLTQTSTLIKKKKNIWRSGDETEEKKVKKKKEETEKSINYFIPL